MQYPNYIFDTCHLIDPPRYLTGERDKRRWWSALAFIWISATQVWWRSDHFDLDDKSQRIWQRSHRHLQSGHHIQLQSNHDLAKCGAKERFEHSAHELHDTSAPHHRCWRQRYEHVTELQLFEPERSCLIEHAAQESNTSHNRETAKQSSGGLFLPQLECPQHTSHSQSDRFARGVWLWRFFCFTKPGHACSGGTHSWEEQHHRN